MGAEYLENGLMLGTPLRTSMLKTSQNVDAAALHQHYSVKTKEIKTFQPSCSRGNRTCYFSEGWYRTAAIIIALLYHSICPRQFANLNPSRLWLNVSRRP